MNRCVLYKASRQKYRKYAFYISVVVHLMFIMVVMLFLINSETQELEDEIQVGLIPELPQQRIVKKRPKLIIKRETPSAETPEPRIEIAKIPAGSATAVDIHPTALKFADVDVSTLADAPDLSTDADLPTTPKSILSPTGKGVGRGTSKINAGRNNGKGTGSGGTGNSTFGSMIGGLTDAIIESSGGLPIDVVFIVDASGSMTDNINSVAEHLGQMVDAYKAAEIDYQLGLTRFRANFITHKTYQNDIQVWQLTNNLAAYKARVYEIRSRSTADENALDAIHHTLKQLKFRTDTIKHLIVVTDESFTTLEGHTLEHIIKQCQRTEFIVHVLGGKFRDHRRLAAATGGSWHAIPQDPRKTTPHTQTSLTGSGNAQQIRNAILADAQQIGNAILADAANIPVDIILFIDGSKSMTDKMQYLTQQIDLWIHNWDNALIEYRLGAVRFHKSRDINWINIFKPPQTQAQLQAILQLICQDNEDLIHAVTDATRKLELRPNTKTHFILITDEPGTSTQQFAGTIASLKEHLITVHVLGAGDPFQQQVALKTGGVFVKIPNAHKQNKLYK